MLEEFFTELVGGFARLITAGFIVWMVSVVILLFRELFRPGDIHLKSYLYKVWQVLIFSFEITSYGGIPVSLYLIKSSDETLRYSIVLVLAILASAFFVYRRLNKRQIGFQ